MQFIAYLSVFLVGLIGCISQPNWAKKDENIDKDDGLCSDLNNLSVNLMTLKLINYMDLNVFNE